MEKSNIVEDLIKRENERQQDVLKKKNEKKLTNAENEQYNYFNVVFDKKCKEIELTLDSTSTLNKSELTIQFDQLFKELNILKKFMADSLMFLRGYDIRISNQRLQELETKIKKLEESLLPKKKFGFKNKKTPKENILKDEVDGNQMIKKNISLQEHFYGFRNNTDEKLVLERETMYKKDVCLENLNNCTVLLLGTPSTLQLSSLKNCVIISGPVHTSVFAENCTECRLVIACQQLRLHSSKKCDVYLHVTSKAIIEDCSEIKLAPYNFKYKNINDDFASSGLDIETNNWNSIDDFNWLVANKQSPNWCVLEEPARVSHWDSIVNSKNIQ